MEDPQADCGGQVGPETTHEISVIPYGSQNYSHTGSLHWLWILLLSQGALYGMAQSIPDRSLVSEIAGGFFDAYYSTDRPQQNGSKQ